MDKGKLALILAIVSIVVTAFCPDSVAFIVLPIGIILAIVSLVLAGKVKKDGKNSTASTVISIISLIIGGLALFGYIVLSNQDLTESFLCVNENAIKDCINNNDGTSTCKFAGSEIKCKTEILKESQLKK